MSTIRTTNGAQETSRALANISEEIERSREILKLPEDWDGEGSVGYSEDTWVRVRDFVWNQAKAYWERHHRAIDCPRIEPGPNGRIDIHWKTNTSELLINVPVNRDESLSFYGDTKAGSHIKGSLKDSDYKQAMWLWLQDESWNLGK